MNDPKIPRLDTDNEYQQTIPDEAEDAKIRAKWDAFPYKIMQSDGEKWHEVASVPAKAAPMSPEAASIILELIQQVIATLLYFARAAHDQNPTAPAQVPFASLPKAWQADFAGVAQMAVNGLQSDKRQAAERAALIHAERWLKAYCTAKKFRVDVGHVADKIVAELTDTTGPNIVTEILAAYQEALCRK